MTKKKKSTTTSDPAVVTIANNFDKVSGIVSTFNRQYGRELFRTGDSIPKIHKVPFDEPMLDYVYTGGVPLSRVTELLGEPHSGKTRNALKAMSKFQTYCFGCMTPRVLKAVWVLDKDGQPTIKSCKCSNCENPETKVQAMVDVEGTTDPKFMEAMGIDINGVIYVRPDRPSHTVDIIDAFLREPTVGLILLDSIGSMGSDREVDEKMEDNKMNQNAVFFNRAMRKWQMALNSNTNQTGKENGTSIIVVNQSYQTLSIYSTEVAQGGRGLRHGKGLSVKNKIGEKNKDPKSHEIYGIHVRVTNEKNKTGMPYRRGEYYLNLDPHDTELGYCQTNINLQYVELAIKFNIIEQRGGWFYHGTEKWQGKANLIDNISDDIREAVDKIIYE
jgi:RecA/RadA recombinase